MNNIRIYIIAISVVISFIGISFPIFCRFVENVLAKNKRNRRLISFLIRALSDELDCEEGMDFEIVNQNANNTECAENELNRNNDLQQVKTENGLYTIDNDINQLKNRRRFLMTLYSDVHRTHKENLEHRQEIKLIDAELSKKRREYIVQTLANYQRESHYSILLSDLITDLVIDMAIGTLELLNPKTPRLTRRIRRLR